MKRRKKLWIALAALAVVVVMCALALIYRPVPFQFLEGSRYEKTELIGLVGGSSDELAVRTYRVSGNTDSVTAKVATELRGEDGWQIEHHRGNVRFFKTGPSQLVFLEWEADPFGTVRVDVIQQATLLDRFLQWLEYR